jgi:hypothetical protein
MDVTNQLHVPAVLPPGKDLRYKLDRRLVETQLGSALASSKISDFTD